MKRFILALALCVFASSAQAGTTEEAASLARDGKYEAARIILQENAQKGDAVAMRLMAEMIHNGLGVQKDPGLAAEWYAASADRGDVLAAYNAGALFLQGAENMEADTDRGLKYLTLAAEKNSSIAQYNLGRLYEQGQVVEKDMVEGLKWIAIASQNRLPLAMRYLDTYKSEAGTDETLKKALIAAADWFAPAADQGDVRSASFAGLLYEANGTTPDHVARAAKYLQAAAEHGIPAAQYRFGEMLFAGRGVTQDKVEGLKWIILAAFRGMPVAITARERYFQDLRQQELVEQANEAQNRANAYIQAKRAEQKASSQ